MAPWAPGMLQICLYRPGMRVEEGTKMGVSHPLRRFLSNAAFVCLHSTDKNLVMELYLAERKAENVVFTLRALWLAQDEGSIAMEERENRNWKAD